MNLSFKRVASILLMLSLLSPLLVTAATTRALRPTQREHLTPEEIEMVRDNQELDKRTGVFIKAAERRFLAITDPQAASRQSAKDAETWGALKGTRTQLLSDFAGILDEAVTNIDDTADRAPTSPTLKKSLNKLAEASRRFLPPLAALRDASQDEAERDALENVIERAQEIIEAAKNHPSDEKEDEPKGGKKKSGVQISILTTLI